MNLKPSSNGIVRCPHCEFQHNVDGWNDAMHLICAFVEVDEGKYPAGDLYKNAVNFLHQNGWMT